MSGQKWLKTCTDCGRIIISYDGSYDRPICRGVKRGKYVHAACVFIKIGDTVCREYTKHFDKEIR